MAKYLVAGVDSSTQSCKVLICDPQTGRVLRSGKAPHPSGTQVWPQSWLDAYYAAVSQAGGLSDVAAISVAGQQHGLVTLDQDGNPVREALLWNDTRSSADAADLINEAAQGDQAKGRAYWVNSVGSVPVASLTVTKLRWMSRCEKQNLEKTRAICLPHDFLTWKILGGTRLDNLITDRSDASGTGYFDAVTNEYRRDILTQAVGSRGSDLRLPVVLPPSQAAGVFSEGAGEILVGPGMGDNAAASLGLNQITGQVVMSLGTSGVVSAVSPVPLTDSSGDIAGFADATGGFLPLVCTLNASQVLDVTARLLGVTWQQFDQLALSAPPGSQGLVFVPYLAGERTPNLPWASGSIVGATLSNLNAQNLARAAVEGVLCLVGQGIELLRRRGVCVESVTLIGGAARSRAVQQLSAEILGLPVNLPRPAEYVALGAARQAAWVLAGSKPLWSLPKPSYRRAHRPEIMGRFKECQALYVPRLS